MKCGPMRWDMARTRTWAKTNVSPRLREMKQAGNKRRTVLRSPRRGGSGEDGRRHHAPYRGRGPELAAEPCGRELVGAGVTSYTFCTRAVCAHCRSHRDCLEAFTCARRRVAGALGEGWGGAHQRQTKIPKGMICTRMSKLSSLLPTCAQSCIVRELGLQLFCTCDFAHCLLQCPSRPPLFEES